MTVPPIILAELNAAFPLRDFSEVEPADHLFDDLGFDSLHRVTVAIGLEEELGIEIADNVIEAWWHVADIIESVRTALPQEAIPA